MKKANPFRELRLHVQQQHKLTSSAIAQAFGVTKLKLSQMETGQADPSPLARPEVWRELGATDAQLAPIMAQLNKSRPPSERQAFEPAMSLTLELPDDHQRLVAHQGQVIARVRNLLGSMRSYVTLWPGSEDAIENGMEPEQMLLIGQAMTEVAQKLIDLKTQLGYDGVPPVPGTFEQAPSESESSKDGVKR